MANLERIKKFEFKGVEYQVQVPNVGEYIDIENEKIIQSNGHWSELLKNPTISSLRSIQIIECVSILKVLCPKLFSNMNVSSYKEIDAIDFIELLTVYNSIISPWFSEWFKQFNDIIMKANNKLGKE